MTDNPPRENQPQWFSPRPHPPPSLLKQITICAKVPPISSQLLPKHAHGPYPGLRLDRARTRDRRSAGGGRAARRLRLGSHPSFPPPPPPPNPLQRQARPRRLHPGYLQSDIAALQVFDQIRPESPFGSARPARGGPRATRAAGTPQQVILTASPRVAPPRRPGFGVQPLGRGEGVWPVRRVPPGSPEKPPPGQCGERLGEPPPPRGRAGRAAGVAVVPGARPAALGGVLRPSSAALQRPGGQASSLGARTRQSTTVQRRSRCHRRRHSPAPPGLGAQRTHLPSLPASLPRTAPPPQHRPVQPWPSPQGMEGRRRPHASPPPLPAAAEGERRATRAVGVSHSAPAAGARGRGVHWIHPVRAGGGGGERARRGRAPAGGRSGGARSHRPRALARPRAHSRRGLGPALPGAEPPGPAEPNGSARVCRARARRQRQPHRLRAR
uniref:Uncharacterized protein LOC109693434 n=1 Tax=Castor canadensis TaxID=51338 RepID=A0A8B7VGZ1_CASCN|nr:uncharacterized protein LOC109693434 [Castor canadensis]